MNLKSEETMKMKAIDHILKTCNERECFKVIQKAYETIDRIERVTEVSCRKWLSKN